MPEQDQITFNRETGYLVLEPTPDQASVQEPVRQKYQMLPQALIDARARLAETPHTDIHRWHSDAPACE